jgi:uncharacterized protein YciI
MMRCTLLTHVVRLQADANKLVMAGALTDPVDGAIFIFRQATLFSIPIMQGLRQPLKEPTPCCCRNVSKDDIEQFVQADPYVKAGLVPNYTIRP